MKRPRLPSFEVPPVSEVVLGVQFDSIGGFLSPHFGLAWNKFRKDYPRIEEHPPIPPAFELFGPIGSPSLPVHFMMQAGPPRAFFISESGTRLFQLQNDRFLHNWRKISEGDIYPRFEPLLDGFVKGYKKIQETLETVGLGKIIPNQCEISYVNHLASTESTQVNSMVAGLFGGIGEKLLLGEFGRPEDARFLFRYVIKEKSGVPSGRLSISAEPVYRPNGESALQLTLTVRGAPSTSSLDGVVKFIKAGRSSIVKSFVELTDEIMHRNWRRVQ